MPGNAHSFSAVGGESLIRPVIEVRSQQDGDLGRFEHRRPITARRGNDAQDLCDSLRRKRHSGVGPVDGHLAAVTDEGRERVPVAGRS